MMLFLNFLIMMRLVPMQGERHLAFIRFKIGLLLLKVYNWLHYPIWRKHHRIRIRRKGLVRLLKDDIYFKIYNE